MIARGLMVAGLVLAAAGAARAGGFAVAEQSASAGGTAGAGTARADDASAAWYNPAALADDGGFRFGIGLLAARPSITATAGDGSWEQDAESRWSTPPHLHLSVAMGDLALGVAVGVPFGSGVSWPGDWQGRYEIVSTRLEVVRTAPFVAWRRGKLGVAAGLHLDAGRMRVNRKLDFIDVEGDVFIDMSGTGVGAHAAVFYQASDELALGATYKSRTTLQLDGGADFTAPDAFNMKTVDQNAGTELTLPDRFAVGARWARGELAVLGDLELTTWSVYDRLVIDFAEEQTPDAMQVNEWKTTLALRGGVEWQADADWLVRGGAFYDPSPARDDTAAPSSPDSTRVGATAGASYALGGWSFDAFYEHMRLLGRDAANVNALDASYAGSAHLLGLGIRYQD